MAPLHLKRPTPRRQRQLENEIAMNISSQRHLSGRLFVVFGRVYLLSENRTIGHWHNMAMRCASSRRRGTREVKETKELILSWLKRSQRWNDLQICPRRASNTGDSDLWCNTLLLDHGGGPVRPRRRCMALYQCEMVINTEWIIYAKVLSIIQAAKIHRMCWCNFEEALQKYHLTPNDLKCLSIEY